MRERPRISWLLLVESGLLGLFGRVVWLFFSRLIGW
jgi:hypothetical protein